MSKKHCKSAGRSAGHPRYLTPSQRLPEFVRRINPERRVRRKEPITFFLSQACEYFCKQPFTISLLRFG
jgi:hypothetical protein